MVEYTRDKILPEDLIQKTNLQQHNFMITAINDIDGRQADIEDVTNVNIDDIADLKTNVVALSNEKLDKADIDADLHFGDISVTRDGTAVIMSLDVFNPTTSITTPISFTIPGATSALAGSMDASSVAWIAGAEERISALEGLSDVKAVSGLSSEPTQAQLNYAWVAATSKQAETGDIIQDIDNAKLWVFITDTWILYGTLVVVPMATTTSIGGIKDTALNTVGNRWYCHVEVDGRVALIGGDVLSTLVDTTVPALQSAINNAVKKTGDTMSGRLYANGDISIERNGEGGIANKRLDVGYNTIWTRFKRDVVVDKDNKIVGESVVTCTNNDPTYGMITSNILAATSYKDDGTPVTCNLSVRAQPTGDCFVTIPMRATPGASDIINKGYLDTRLTSKQDTLVFDSTPILNSTKPVTSGGIYNNLLTKADKSELTAGLALKADAPTWTYGSGTLTTNAGTCGYNYAYSVIGDVVTMRFTVGPSVDDQFTVPLPVGIASASVQCIGIADDARFWVDYGGTSTNAINVNRAQTTIQEHSFHMLVIGQPSG
jgi:hypothetical protein